VAELTRRFHLPSALRSSPSRISREAARDLVARGALVIDVRRHDDDSDRLQDALRISPDMIPTRVAGFRRDVPIVLACTCTREATSVRVAHWLRDRGFVAYAVRGGAAELGDRAEGRSVALSEPVDRGPGAGPLAALRYRQFRRYSAGVLISLTGNWVEAAAFGYVVLLLGGSAATLALIGFLNTIPNLIWGLPAGALADRFDQRKLLLGFQGANMCVAVLLAVLWQTGSLTVPLLGAIALVGGSLGTLSFPAFQGLLASTVPRRALEGAVAINSLLLQLARFLGPAIAGFLLAVGGPTWVFAVNAVSFLGVFTAVALLAGSPAAAGQAAERLGGAMKEGLRYVFGQRSLASLIVLTLVGGVFGTPPVAFMLPGIVRFQLDAGPATLGALTSALGLGSLLASVALLSLARRANKGEPVLAGYFLSALAIAAVGVSSSIPVSLALALVGGFCGVLFVGLSTVVVQAMASDEMRARAMAIWAAAFVGLLPLGALITAGLAAWLGVGGAVLVDGLVMFVGGLVVIARRPELAWLGCAALPEACLASTNPAAVAIEGDLHAPDPVH
jgi:MFS family permease/rhodanese-related sulfurtransferase